MISVELIGAIAELFGLNVARVVALLMILKSLYNGYVRSLIQNIQQIPEIAERVDSISKRQDTMVEGITALSIAYGDESAEIDTDRLLSDLHEGERKSYLKQNGHVQFVDDEEEEEEEQEQDEEERETWPRESCEDY